MGNLHSRKCIVYANLYILNMKKILTYNPSSRLCDRRKLLKWLFNFIHFKYEKDTYL